MANLNITNIPAPRVPFVDERTGLMAREWYRFFLNLFVLTGSGNNPITLEELQIGPPNQPDLTELLIQINQNIAPQYEDQSGDFLATLDTAQLMSMMSRFENAEAAIQGAYLQPVVQTGTIANYNLDGSPTGGGIAYGTGPELAVSAAGTVGQVLTSAGAGTPTWTAAASGTVTSVAALTLGTTGTDLSSTVANPTTTPVITLQVPTASAANRGALSAADWTTFNSKGSGSVTSVAQSFTGGLISVAGSPITSSGTLALTVAGTSGGIPYFSSASTWASSAALAAGSLVLGGGAGVTPATTATGTGVVTALGVNTGTAGAFVVNGGALGTPSSGIVTNLTGTASININGTVGATTANTGAFTTGTFSSTLGVSDLLTVTRSNATFKRLGTFLNSAVGTIFIGSGTSAAYIGTDNFPLNFYTNGGGGVDNTSVPTNIGLSIATSGAVTIPNTLGVTTGIGCGAATPQTGGLAFPATQIAVADANTLDDYEEGTWAPAITGTGGSFTHSSQKGFYTKVGRLVTVQFYVTGTKNTVSGTLTITGLPFTTSSTTGAYVTFRMGLWYVVGGTAMVDVNGFINLGVTAINIYYITAADVTNEANTLSATQLSAGTQFGGVFSYII